jgi:hypothetical protein
MNDDEVIRQRIEGHRKGAALTVADIVIDRRAASAIDVKMSRDTLPLELARLDELQETFYARALEGDV